MTTQKKQSSQLSSQSTSKRISRVKKENAATVTHGKGENAAAPSQYKGSLDGYDSGYIFGWAYNGAAPEQRVRVQVFSGVSVVAQGLADRFREDLLEAALGDGYYSFRLPVLANQRLSSKGGLSLVCDGNHVLETKSIVVGDGDGDGLNVKLTDLDGPVLNGVITNSVDSDGSLGYQVLVDSEPAGYGIANKLNDGAYAISFLLPPTYFDGQAHRITVMVEGNETCQADLVDILPPILTPWIYLSHGKDTSSQLYFSLPGAVSRRLTMLKDWASIATDTNDMKALAKAQLALRVLNEGYVNRSKFPKLELPEADQPEVSIVIPVHNKFELTYHCLASLILSHNKTSFEVIVVDDVSDDETINITQYVANVRVIINQKNLGFLRNCNMAVAQAKGKYLVMLNNDTEVGPSWLDEMLDVFGRFEKVGAVGAKLLYPDGKLQEAGGIVWSNGEPWNLGRNGNPYDPQWNYVRQTDYLTGAAIMVPKALWDEVGGFSDEYAPCYYEDTDLCFKLRKAGWGTYYTPHAEIIHFEGQSNGIDTSSGLKRYQTINAPKFRQKWVDDYQHNGDPATENLWRHKDRGVRYRALVIDYATPQPDKDAGSYAAVKELKLLQALGFKLSFIPENLAHFGPYTQDLQKQGVECLHAPFSTSIEQVLRERGHEFDLVYITRYNVAERYIEIVRKHAPRAKIMFNNADLHFLRELRAALAKGDKDLSGQITTRDRELDVMRKVDAILSYNDTEHAVITSHLLRADNIFKCPWVLEAKGHKTPFEKRNGIAFLGGYRHPPNVEAVEWFIKNMMPLLRAQSKKIITFHVYGSHLPDQLKKLATDDIEMHGFVENLDEVFETCRVFVAPLQSGAGIKGKVLDAISYGVPTVLSPIAAEGIDVSDGTSVMIARTTTHWCEAILALYNDPKQWQTLSNNALTQARKNYSFEHGYTLMGKPLQYLGFFSGRREIYAVTR